MNGEARKLYLIEALLKEDDENILSDVEALLIKRKTDTGEKKTFKDFAGIWTEEEAEEIKKFIEEGCEQIHPDDWK